MRVFDDEPASGIDWRGLIGQLLLVEPEGTRHAIAAADVVQLAWPRPANNQRDEQREG